MFTNSTLFSFNEGKTSNKDVEIYYRDYGPINAEPILLVQGLGGQLINWPQHLIEFLLENNFRPIVFDNRDTGLSSRIESNSFDDKKRSNTIIKSYVKYYLRLPIKSEYTIDDMADDAITVLDELKISKAHILGIFFRAKNAIWAKQLTKKLIELKDFLKKLVIKELILIQRSSTKIYLLQLIEVEKMIQDLADNLLRSLDQKTD